MSPYYLIHLAIALIFILAYGIKTFVNAIIILVFIILIGLLPYLTNNRITIDFGLGFFFLVLPVTPLIIAFYLLLVAGGGLSPVFHELKKSKLAYVFLLLILAEGILFLIIGGKTPGRSIMLIFLVIHFFFSVAFVLVFQSFHKKKVAASLLSRLIVFTLIPNIIFITAIIPFASRLFLI
jgi:hypothetical protein